MEYAKLCKFYSELEKNPKRLAKTYIISGFLKECSKDDLSVISLLIQGRLFPHWDESKIGVASRLVLKAISLATGISHDKVEKEWKKTGDLGLVAFNLISVKKQRTLFSSKLTVKKVFDNLRKLPSMEGLGAVEKKVSLISELLTSAKPIEAKYIVRTVLEEMRIGVGEGSLRDAIVWAFFAKEISLKYNPKENDVEVKDREEYNKYVNAVQHAYDLTNDFSAVVEKAKVHGLKGLLKEEISVFTPIKVMLALKVKDVNEAFERVGKPAEIEFKYDGFRIQIHKKGSDVKLFTRRLDEVTKQFSELIPLIKKNIKGDFIIDSECVGYDPKTKKYLPFQNISQRIRRKYDIEIMAKKFPVELNLFDIIYYNGKNLIKSEFKERRKLLEKIVKPVAKKLVLAKKKVTSSEKDADAFYKEALKLGNEGVIFKNMKAPYKPGARVGHMIKLKPVMDTLDLVIVGAEWGEGKRSSWMSSFILACIDKKGKLLEIGKVGTGIKEKGEGVTFKQLTSLLRPLIISEKGKTIKIKPKIVVEINYEEIQKSTNYSSGYALRFPRLVNLRPDRRSKDIADLEIVEKYYREQKKI